MYKVAVITNTLYDKEGVGKTAGGGYVVTAELISQLKNMPEVELSVIAYKNNLSSAPEYNVVIFSSNNINDFIKKADDYIKINNFDLVLTLNIEQIYKNNFLQAHSVIYKCNKQNFLMSAIKKQISKKRIEKEKNIFKNTTLDSEFIAMSEAIKEDYSKTYNIQKEKIKVIYPGCNQVFKEFETPLKKTEPVFGIVANSSINKGGHLFLLSAGILKLLGCKFQINIIAPKYNSDILMKFIVNIFRLKNKINVLDKQENMSEFYKNIDILVMPSFFEAFGLVPLETASYFKPSVVSSSCGICEILDKDNSFIFRSKSVFSLINTLKKVYNIYHNNYDLYINYCKKAFELSKKYSWERFAQEIISIINN